MNKNQEVLSKGLKKLGTAAAMMGALATSSPASVQAPKPSPQEQKQVDRQSFHSKIKSAIGSTESNDGQNTNHKPTIHGSAYGRFGIMPDTIRETIAKNPDLMQAHGKATKLSGQDLHHYMQDNPQLEDQITDRHIERLRKIFGDNPAKIGFAWLNGVQGTHNAIKNKKDINSHWHVRKIMKALNKRK